MAHMVNDKPQGGYAKHAPYGLDAFKLNLPALTGGIRALCNGLLSAGAQMNSALVAVMDFLDAAALLCATGR